MIINNVRIFLNTDAEESNFKATATMLVNNQFLLQSIRVFKAEGDKEFQVVYPIQRMNNGSLRHCMYPSNAKAKAKFDAAVLEAYQKVLSGETDGNTVVFSEDTDRTSYEITPHTIYPSKSSALQRAKIGLELDGEIWLRGINMVVRENNSLFLNMPRRQMGEGKDLTYFHPIDQDARNVFTAAVIPFYEEALPSWKQRR